MTLWLSEILFLCTVRLPTGQQYRCATANFSERTLTMNDFMNPDNPIMDFLRKISNIIILNVTFLLSCIPIITIGAAITSLYTVSFKIAKLEDPYIWKTYWHAFRQNFRQSTGIWLICIPVFGLLLLDFMFLQAQSSSFAAYVQLALWAVTFVFVSVFHYIFPGVAHFVCTIGQYWKNALLMSLAHLPYTVLFLVIDGVIAFLCIYSVHTLGMVVMLMMICGFSCIALIKAFLFLRIFKIYDSKLEESQQQIESI